jgi:hypothetical protein
MAGDELSLVDDYFPEESASSGDAYDDSELYGEEETPNPANAEMGLVEEYRQEGFDADEVAGWREVVNDVATGAYSADDYLSTLEEDDAEDEDGGWDGYSEVEGLGEPAPVLSPDEALEALMLLPPEQMAQGIQYLEQNHPGLGQPLVEAYVDRQQREKLTENWLHLDNLNQVLAERQDRQKQIGFDSLVAAVADRLAVLDAAAAQELREEKAAAKKAKVAA